MLCSGEVTPHSIPASERSVGFRQDSHGLISILSNCNCCKMSSKRCIPPVSSGDRGIESGELPSFLVRNIEGGRIDSRMRRECLKCGTLWRCFSLRRCFLLPLIPGTGGAVTHPCQAAMIPACERYKNYLEEPHVTFSARAWWSRCILNKYSR